MVGSRNVPFKTQCAKVLLPAEVEELCAVGDERGSTCARPFIDGVSVRALETDLRVGQTRFTVGELALGGALLLLQTVRVEWVET